MLSTKDLVAEIDVTVGGVKDVMDTLLNQSN